jgi:hypothetical protein
MSSSPRLSPWSNSSEPKMARSGWSTDASDHVYRTCKAKHTSRCSAACAAGRRWTSSSEYAQRTNVGLQVQQDIFYSGKSWCYRCCISQSGAGIWLCLSALGWPAASRGKPVFSKSSGERGGRPGAWRGARRVYYLAGCWPARVPLSGSEETTGWRLTDWERSAVHWPLACWRHFPWLWP